MSRLKKTLLSVQWLASYVVFWLKGRSWSFWILGVFFLIFFLCFSTFVGFSLSSSTDAMVSSAVVKQGDFAPIDYCSLSQVPIS